MRRLATPFLTALFFIASSSSYACDLCGLYDAPYTKVFEAGATRFVLNEQYTRYNNLQKEDRVIDNKNREEYDSSITTLAGEHYITDSLSAQVHLPFISRSYKRMEDGVRTSGDERGIGDMVLLTSYAPIRRADANGFLRWNLSLGVKLPTGDSDMLRSESHHEEDAQMDSGEDSHEEHLDGDHMGHAGHSLRHGDEDHSDPYATTAIHGHELALGSGSTDVIFGTSGLWEANRRMIRAGVQYVLRTEGDHGYQYANDLVWEVVPGYYIVADEGFSFLATFNLSGEHKGKDEQNGVKDNDTAFTSLFVGPGVGMNFGEHVRLKLNMDFPADINNSGVQLVADWRFRGGLDISL